MSKAATPPMIISKAHDMSNWRIGEVESFMGVSHSRVIEDASISHSASLTVEKMTPADVGFMQNEPDVLNPALLHVLSTAPIKAS